MILRFASWGLKVSTIAHISALAAHVQHFSVVLLTRSRRWDAPCLLIWTTSNMSVVINIAVIPIFIATRTSIINEASIPWSTTRASSSVPLAPILPILIPDCVKDVASAIRATRIPATARHNARGHRVRWTPRPLTAIQIETVSCAIAFAISPVKFGRFQRHIPDILIADACAIGSAQH